MHILWRGQQLLSSNCFHKISRPCQYLPFTSCYWVHNTRVNCCLLDRQITLVLRIQPIPPLSLMWNLINGMIQNSDQCLQSQWLVLISTKQLDMYLTVLFDSWWGRAGYIAAERTMIWVKNVQWQGNDRLSKEIRQHLKLKNRILIVMVITVEGTCFLVD